LQIISENRNERCYRQYFFLKDTKVHFSSRFEVHLINRLVSKWSVDTARILLRIGDVINYKGLKLIFIWIILKLLPILLVAVLVEQGNLKYNYLKKVIKSILIGSIPSARSRELICPR
jgi:hypothetical protein